MTTHNDNLDLLSLSVDDAISNADDPLQTLRSILGKIESQIAAQRSVQVRLQAKQRREKRSLDALQEKLAVWQSQLDKARQNGDERKEASALSARERVSAEHKEAEMAWWSTSKECEAVNATLNALYDKAQDVRRRKETLISKKQASRSSSDVIVLPKTRETELEDHFSIEAELNRLKEARNESGSDL